MAGDHLQGHNPLGAACRTAQDAQEAEDRYGAIFHSRSDLALYSRGYGWYSKGKWADRVVPGGVLRGTDRTVKLGRYHPVPRSVPLEIWISPRSTPRYHPYPFTPKLSDHDHASRRLASSLS